MWRAGARRFGGWSQERLEGLGGGGEALLEELEVGSGVGRSNSNEYDWNYCAGGGSTNSGGAPGAEVAGACLRGR